MPGNVFVARDKELLRLASFLEKALAGHGQIVFVTGEAGTGKTALVREFVRRSQQVYGQLIAAVGECNAQTGLSDPYLPFREVLGVLTGDIEAKLAQGAITQENANRLRSFFRVSGDVLVNLGPDLIGIFVPGAGLVAKAGTWLAGKAGWLGKLEKLSERKAAGHSDMGLDQSRIFEEYTDVLKALAAKQPLVVAVDDLHWADAASIELLFHLSRKLVDTNVLMIGTFRPNDISIGREGQPHPLARVFNELKRYRGDIEINLEGDGTIGDEEDVIEPGAEFVNRYLDAAYAPNDFQADFRYLIAQRTEGHPLFTVELLRMLEERGVIQFNDQHDSAVGGTGRWTQTRAVDLAELPTRVEAVIAERVNRLREDLRDELSVAAVEGEEFTAQVLARVRQENERDLVKRLIQELDKQHHLIREMGIVRIDSTQLFKFLFRHSLFHIYLYYRLGVAERILLHASVGEVLEALYGDEAQQISVSLAYHFVEAQDTERGIKYTLMAGDQAKARYANAEALRLYGQTVELVHKAPESQKTIKWQLELYSKQGEVWQLTGEYDKAVEQYRMMLAKARQVRDKEQIIAALYHLGHAHRRQDRNADALRYLNEAAELAREIGNQKVLADVLYYTGTVYYSTGVSEKAIQSQQASLIAASRADDLSSRALSHHGLGESLWSGDEPERAIEHLKASLTLCETIKDKSLAAENLCILGLCYGQLGNFGEAIKYCEESIRLSQDIEDRYNLAWAMYAYAYCLLNIGEYQEALTWTQRSLEKNQQINSPRLNIWNLDIRGETYLALGDVARALEASQAAWNLFAEKEVGSWRKPIVLSNIGQMYIQIGQLDMADKYLTQALDTIREGGSPLEEERIYRGLAMLALLRGQPLQASFYAGQLSFLAEHKRLKPMIALALILKSEIDLSQEQFDAAQESGGRAVVLAEEMHCSPLLWQAHAVLGRIYTKQGRKEDARAAYQKAAATIQMLADKIIDPELKATYLGERRVRTVFEAVPQFEERSS